MSREFDFINLMPSKYNTNSFYEELIEVINKYDHLYKFRLNKKCFKIRAKNFNIILYIKRKIQKQKNYNNNKKYLDNLNFNESKSNKEKKANISINESNESISKRKTENIIDKINYKKILNNNKPLCEEIEIKKTKIKYHINLMTKIKS